MQKTLPAAEVISNVAGHITLGVPHRALGHLPKFITALEEAKEQDPLFVEEWGVEATTLEEVFLKLAASKKVNAEIEGGRAALCTLCCAADAAVVTTRAVL